MKILLTNDLHGCEDWYDWLLAQAPLFDLIAIAGDLFDGFSDDGLIPQVLEFDRFVAALRKTGCCLAFSTGNHDGNIGLDADQMLKTFAEDGPTDPRAQKILTCEYWPDAFDFQSEFGQGTVVTDNRASILSFPTGERILVSTHPYAFDDSDRGIGGMRDSGRRRRKSAPSSECAGWQFITNLRQTPRSVESTAHTRFIGMSTRLRRTTSRAVTSMTPLFGRKVHGWIGSGQQLRLIRGSPVAPPQGFPITSFWIPPCDWPNGPPPTLEML